MGSKMISLVLSSVLLSMSHSPNRQLDYHTPVLISNVPDTYITSIFADFFALREEQDDIGLAIRGVRRPYKEIWNIRKQPQI